VNTSPPHSSDISLPREVKLKDGSRATLRRLREDDAEQVCRELPKAHAETDFLQYLPGEFDWTPQREREFIREHVGQPRRILLCAECESKILALCGARPAPFRRSAHQAEIGITVFRAYWGIGLGRQMMEFILAWSQAEGLKKLMLRVFEDNTRAIRLYQSLGFLEEGRLRQDVLRADGRYSDSILMGRFNL
jgi:RimJ/RimL family protein N-acetyltransferase